MNIFSFSNYREYIRQEILRLRSLGQFSYRGFNQRAGLKSPNFLKLVMDGKRNLSIEGARKVALGFSLNAEETRYFESLVLANQSKQVQSREQLTHGLLKLRKKGGGSGADDLDYNYYRDWFNIPIREALFVKQSKRSLEELAKKFRPKLQSQDIEKAFETLAALKMIRKDSKGQWEPTKVTLRTNDFFINSMLLAFHAKMLDLAKEALTSFGPEDREFGAVTVALSKESFEKVRVLTQDLKKKVLKIAEEDQHKEDVVQLNLQLFPLTKGLKDEK